MSIKSFLKPNKEKVVLFILLSIFIIFAGINSSLFFSNLSFIMFIFIVSYLLASFISEHLSLKVKRFIKAILVPANIFFFGMLVYEASKPFYLGDSKDIILETDKQIYHANEEIKLTIRNNSSYDIWYYSCPGFYFKELHLQHYLKNGWNSIVPNGEGVLVDCERKKILKTLKKSESVTATIPLKHFHFYLFGSDYYRFDRDKNQIYRLEFPFMWRAYKRDPGYRDISYSNEFKIIVRDNNVAEWKLSEAIEKIITGPFCAIDKFIINEIKNEKIN